MAQRERSQLRRCPHHLTPSRGGPAQIDTVPHSQRYSASMAPKPTSLPEQGWFRRPPHLNRLSSARAKSRPVSGRYWLTLAHRSGTGTGTGTGTPQRGYARRLTQKSDSLADLFSPISNVVYFLYRCSRAVYSVSARRLQGARTRTSDQLFGVSLRTRGPPSHRALAWISMARREIVRRSLHTMAR
jgi:hypothetical protein